MLSVSPVALNRVAVAFKGVDEEDESQRSTDTSDKGPDGDTFVKTDEGADKSAKEADKAKEKPVDDRPYAEKVGDITEDIKATGKAVTDTIAAGSTAVGATILAGNGAKETLKNSLDDQTKGFFRKIGDSFTKDHPKKEMITKDGVKKIKQVADWKKIGIAGAIIAAVVAGIALYKNATEKKADKD